MDKISGIVPQSKRVSAVDLKSSLPVRPGTPTFGRPVGVSTALDLSKPSTAELAVAKQQELLDKRKMLSQGPEMVQEMADRFFMQKIANQRPEEGEPEDMELTPPGSYLDVQV